MDTCYCGLVARGESSYTALPVLGTRELRGSIPRILAGFRRLGAKAQPVFCGAHRRPEAVFLPYERYAEMLEKLDNAAIVTVVEARLPAADERLGDNLDVVARELGFDPDEIFAKG